MLYLDSSAIVKLVQREDESAALRRFLRRNSPARRVTSALARVEVVRAVLPAGPQAIGHAHRQLARLHRLAVDDEILERASTLPSANVLRSLDAIHVASAQSIGAGLLAVVTYDDRMIRAANDLGLTTESPR